MSISRFIFQTLAKTLSTKGLYIVKSLSYKKKPQSLPANLDYVRYATLGLCYEEITAKEIKGNVAELGVYKGDFAKRLNLLFPEKKLYLFDTFEGFNKLDIKVERDKGFGNAEQDFHKRVLTW